MEGWLAAREAADPGADPADEAVTARIRQRRFDGDRIGVDPEGIGCPELHGRDRQDPRAAADIEHARALDAAVIDDRFEGRQAQSGRRVEAGPERHPRIQREHHIFGVAAVTPPRRADDEASAYAQHGEVGLPGLGPVLLVDDTGAQLADGPQPECLEVPEGLRGRRRGGLGR